VRQRVEAALNKLRHQDPFLVEANTNERTISHKLAEYLQDEFPNWNVDCEYNRHGHDIKKLRNVDVPNDDVGWNEPEAKTIFPDIIVHERNTDKNNLLVIEVKKSSNAESRQFDKDKLTALTKDDYRYRFGLLLEISMNKTVDVLEWYADGRVLHEQRIALWAN
jgi:hypothetical protein